MNIKNISIRTQLLSVMIVLVVAPVVILGVGSFLSAKRETIKQIENDLRYQAGILSEHVRNVHEIALDRVNSDLSVARDVLYSGGRPYIDETQKIEITAVNQITKAAHKVNIPSMKIDKDKVAYNYKVVDKVKNMVGGTTTIFQVFPDGILRISTNVIESNGKRAVGTYIPKDSPVYQTVMKGETFRGRAFVVNSWYITAYEPIKDAKGTIIGVLYVGVREEYFQEAIKNSFSKITIGNSGYVYILNKKGDYVLSAKRQRDGENIWDAKDENGDYIIQNIVTSALKLKNGETGLIHYSWKNGDEKNARMKIACYTYFPEWDWVIASGAYLDEYFGGLERIKSLTMLISVLSMVIVSIIAFIFASFISKAVNSIVYNIQEIAQGNFGLSIDRSRRYNKEINQIIDSFSVMVSKLKDIVSGIFGASQNMASLSSDLSTNVQSVNSVTGNIGLIMSDVSKDTLETNESAQKGRSAARNAEQKIKSISGSFDSASKAVNRLSEKTQEIDDIVKVIENISRQTNLLALNASVEAARAGESGKGFKVVAAEIRKLSDGVQRSTTKIKESIEDIIASVNDSMKTIEEGALEVDAGSRVIAEALESLNNVSEKVSNITIRIGGLTSSGNKNRQSQTTSIEDISCSMREVSDVADNLSSTADEMKHLVNQFRM